MMSGKDLLVAPRVKVLDGNSTLNHDIVMVVGPGQCMASLDLGTRRQGMISGVGTLARLAPTGQFPVLRRLGLMIATGLVVSYTHLRMRVVQQCP